MDEDDLRHEVCSIERVPRLYITDWVGAASVNEANILGITHILSVLSKAELENYGPDENKDVVLRHVDVQDDPKANIAQYFAKECAWLDEVLADAGNSVIVHCQQGVSRSVTIVIAYLIKKFGLSYQEALHEVKQKRSIVNVNPGFVEQLKTWQRKAGGTKLSMPTSPLRKDVNRAAMSSPIDVITPIDVIDFVENKH